MMEDNGDLFPASDIEVKGKPFQINLYCAGLFTFRCHSSLSVVSVMQLGFTELHISVSVFIVFYCCCLSHGEFSPEAMLEIMPTSVKCAGISLALLYTHCTL